MKGTSAEADDDIALGLISATGDGDAIAVDGDALVAEGGPHIEINTTMSVSVTSAFALAAGIEYVFEITTLDSIGGTADCRLITEIHPTSETIANPLAAGGDAPFGLSEGALATATELLGG